MRYPEFLREKGTIGFVAPSFGCNIEPYKSGFDHALERLKGMGHQVVLGSNCYEGVGIGISNTPQKCGEELTEYYCREDSDVLIACGGGELMCETMSHVDLERIRTAKPKWYMGFSDNTNMLFLLTTLCDVAAIYAPCAPAFGMEPWHESIADAYELLCGRKLAVQGYPLWEREGKKDEEHPLEPYNVTEEKELRLFPEESFRSSDGKAGENTERMLTGYPAKSNPDIRIHMQGRLIGGCMDCLVTLLGTRFDGVKEFCERYREDGFLWFLESCDLNVMSIRRAVWQMKEAGWFSHVKGFLIGRPLVHGQEMMGLDQYRAVTELLAEYQVPIVMDVDLGHLPPMMPVVSGSIGNVDVVGNDITVRYELR